MKEILERTARTTAQATGTLNGMLVKRTASPRTMLQIADKLTKAAKELRTVAVAKGAKRD